ncbi:MAG TPA: ribonuclease Z [Rikenellaceae bacterium]|nr:ribonuclease Z [Rikenellaceae bacterium]
MSFSLQILGTASAMPISDRNPSAQALNVSGRLFLIDCGEGTQQRMRQMHLSFLRVEAIFISHIHGDHIFGLFGVLSTMSMYNRTQPLHVFGPEALRSIIRFYLSYFADGSNYEIIFHEVKVRSLTVIWESKNVKVSAFPLDHKIECYGYRFDEVLSKRSLEKRRAVSYAYCSDTQPFPELVDYVRGSTVLYHETTYTKQLSDKASKYFHSSTQDAARLALEAGVEKLLIGHYSSRERNSQVFEAECREIFPNTIAVNDCDVIEIE